MCLAQPAPRRKLLDVPGAVSIGIGQVERDNEVGGTGKEEKRQKQFH